VSFSGRRWRKSSAFELEGHINSGGEEGKKASGKEGGERESVCCGGESCIRKKERRVSRTNYQNAPPSLYFCVPS